MIVLNVVLKVVLKIVRGYRHGWEVMKSIFFFWKNKVSKIARECLALIRCYLHNDSSGWH